ncbi:MAG: hypothetical protein QME66_08890 [Candidatus Eisenbacteria bacterium]|nr:hypothetical protein [Candidatus Eisenbacteria bacterium]
MFTPTYVYIPLTRPQLVRFTLALTLIAISLGLIAKPILQLVLDFPIAGSSDVKFYVPGILMPLEVIGGILMLFITMHLAKAIARLHGTMAKAMFVTG